MTTTRERVLSITVAYIDGRVSAELEPKPPVTRASVTSYEKLEDFIAQYDVPAGTLIYRFDKSSRDAAWAFGTRGPMLNHALPVGHVHPIGFKVEPRPWRGHDEEPWDEIGCLACVAADVYEIMARKAGVVIEIVGQFTIIGQFTPPLTLNVLDTHDGFTAVTTSKDTTLWRPGDVLKVFERGTVGTLIPDSVNPDTFYQNNDKVISADYKVPGYPYRIRVWWTHDGQRLA